MITFFLSIVALLLGYFLYSKVAERIFVIDRTRPTPAQHMADGVDFIPLPLWKIFLIQFLNIAGLGPIFGAVAGAMWGPVAFLWIVLGSVFAGGVHDFFSGMLSLRNNGKGIAEISGMYMGNSVKQFMRGFTVILMIIVGTVFVVGPATILNNLTNDWAGSQFWIWVIFAYYIIATVLPVDKIIGRVYPIFGIALLFMAFGLAVPLVTGTFTIPELSITSFSNQHYSPEKFPIFPMVFITIACGAISGFHATQSPLMARCMTNEKHGRPIFYGTMITEGIVALIWAAIAMSFYGSVDTFNSIMQANGGNAALIVNEIANSVLGKVGGLLALLGVVAAPLTSGDTSFRSARLIIADFLNYAQAPIKNRLLISLPLFAIGIILTQVDFQVIWRYFAWTNQTLAAIVLWTCTAYLVKVQKAYWITFVPAVFMTAVVTCYFLIAPEGLQLTRDLGLIIGLSITAGVTLFALLQFNRQRKALPL